jgi:hypothetical protein
MVAVSKCVWISFAIYMRILRVSNIVLTIARFGIKNALKHGVYPQEGDPG